MDTFNIDNIKRRMLIKYPFFGSAVANLKLKEARGLNTAGTDGKTIYYDPEFLNKLSEDEQSFIFAHEICHIAFNHILRSEGKNPRIWNIATDAVINQFLKKDGLPMVEGGVDIEEAINYDVETLYEKMLKEEKDKEEQQKNNQDNQKQEGNQKDNNNSSSEQQGSNSEQQNEQSDQSQNNEQNSQDQNQSSGSGQSGDNQPSESNENNQSNEQQSSNGGNSKEQQEKAESSSNNDVGHDTHNMWEEAVKRHKEGKDLSDDEQEKKEQNKLNDFSEDKVKEMQDKMEKLGEKKAFKKNEQTRKDQLQELIEAMSREAMGAGSSTNSEIRDTNDIGTSKQLIDWRLWLREAISMDVDWSYQNAEIDDGIIRPNLEAYPIPETEIILDTSGSIHENLLKNFLRECKNILQASRVKVGCFDTQFYGFTEIRKLDDIDNLDYVGGGGTNFDVAVNAFTKRVENKIIFTDGDAPMPRTSINAIWIVFGGKKITPPGGRVIHITDEQLRRLYYETDNNMNNGKTR